MTPSRVVVPAKLGECFRWRFPMRLRATASRSSSHQLVARALNPSIKRIAICVAVLVTSACQDNEVTTPSVATLAPASLPLAASHEDPLQVAQPYLTLDPIAPFGISYEAFNADPYIISDAQLIAEAEVTSQPVSASWETDGEYVYAQLTYNPGDGPPVEPTGTDPQPIGFSMGEEEALKQRLEAIGALSTPSSEGLVGVDVGPLSVVDCWTAYLRAARRCRTIPTPRGRQFCWGLAMAAYAGCRARQT